jgi:hypothetical protein
MPTKILEFWLDFDGCANDMLLYEVATHSVTVNTRHVLFRTIYEYTNECVARGNSVIVILSSGSNRQNFRMDYTNSYKERAGEPPHITVSSFQGLEAIALTLGNLFPVEAQVQVYLDKYLLGDSVSGYAPGSIWDASIEMIDSDAITFPVWSDAANTRRLPAGHPLKEERLYNDDRKTIMTYVKAHRARSRLNRRLADEVNVYFFDDRDDILNFIWPVFLMSNALSRNLTLHLCHYDRENNIINNKIPLVGQGNVNYTWHNYLSTARTTYTDETDFTIQIGNAEEAKRFFSGLARAPSPPLPPLPPPLMMGMVGGAYHYETIADYRGLETILPSSVVGKVKLPRQQRAPSSH